MPGHYHAVLWIDHHDARVIRFNHDAVEEERIHPAHPPRHLHVKAGSAAGTHIEEEPSFYRDVTAALAGAQEILLTGPSSAKAELLKHIEKHAPALMDHIVGVETLNHITDRQLLAEGRRFFARADRMRPRLD